MVSPALILKRKRTEIINNLMELEDNNTDSVILKASDYPEFKRAKLSTIKDLILGVPNKRVTYTYEQKETIRNYFNQFNKYSSVVKLLKTKKDLNILLLIF